MVVLLVVIISFFFVPGTETVQKSGIYMGKRVRFTVCRIWGNDRQNSGLVNFVPESRFTIYHFLPGSNETRISVWNILSGNTGLPFEMFRCSRKFSAEMNQKVVFIFKPDFPETFCKR